MMKFKNQVMLTGLLLAFMIAAVPSAESATLELMGYDGWSKPVVTFAIKTAGAVTEEAIEDVLTAIH